VAQILDEDFSPTFATWGGSNTKRTAALGGADAADANFPYLVRLDWATITEGGGPSGVNAIGPSSATPGDEYNCSAVFRGFGPLTDGYSDGAYIRLKVDIKISSSIIASAASGEMATLQIYGRPYNASLANTYISFWWNDATDATKIFIRRVTRTATGAVSDYNTAELLRADVLDTWHTLQMEFKHCTVNSWNTALNTGGDFDPDGEFRIRWNDTVLYETTGEFVLQTHNHVVANQTKEVELVTLGYFGFIGSFANFEVFTTPPGDGTVADLRLRFHNNSHWYGYEVGDTTNLIRGDRHMVNYQPVWDLWYVTDFDQASESATPIVHTLVSEQYYNYDYWLNVTLA
jgi:hypothetical protein